MLERFSQMKPLEITNCLLCSPTPTPILVCMGPKAHHHIDQSDLSDTGLRDHFLIAMPGLQDPTFAHTIAYVCEHSAEGAMAIVINHPLELSLNDVFAQLEFPPNHRLGRESVLSGGPVQVERGFVLHPSGQNWQSTLRISPDISLTASQDILAAMAENRGPEGAIVALGYAGWGAGQLEEEIASNAWLTVPAESHILFHTPVEQRWSAAAKHLGIDLNLISATAGHA